jgi:predicted transcriptional regulator
LGELKRLSPRVQAIKSEVESLKAFRRELEARFVQMRDEMEKSLGKRLMSGLSKLVEKNVKGQFERLSAELRDEGLRQRKAVKELTDELAAQIKKELRGEMGEKLKKVGVRIDGLAQQIGELEQTHRKMLLGLLKEVQS